VFFFIFYDELGANGMQIWQTAAEGTRLVFIEADEEE